MTQLANPVTPDLSTQRYTFSFPKPSHEDTILMPTVAPPTRSKWDELINKLIEWCAGSETDNKINLGAGRQAVTYARLLDSDQEHLPTRVGPTSNGGVAFEWEDGESVIHIEIIDGRSAEYTEFHGTQLVGDAELIWDQDKQTYYAIDS